jgi:hypothetical protein
VGVAAEAAIADRRIVGEPEGGAQVSADVVADA